MTVKELIAELCKFNEDDIVNIVEITWYPPNTTYYYDIKSIDRSSQDGEVEIIISWGD